MPSSAVTTEPTSPEPRALQRLGQRWAELPLAKAEELAPVVRELAQRVADSTATVAGLRHTPLPDLGPAVVISQLRVALYDARAASDPAEWDAALEGVLSRTYADSAMARRQP